MVLLKDIPGVGRKGEVKTVSDGHALNFLIPRKLAEVGTPAALARAERQRKDTASEAKIQEDLLRKNVSALEGVTLEIMGKANEKGHLFSGIHREQIAEELKKQKHLELPPARIVLEQPLKAVGEYQIAVKVGEKAASFTLVISPLPSSAS